VVEMNLSKHVDHDFFIRLSTGSFFFDRK